MKLKGKITAIAKSKNENSLAIFNLLGPVFLNGINFFTIPVFTRLLGAENFGIVSVYIAWVQIITVIIGLQTTGTISIAKVHLPAEEQRKYRSSILSLSFCSMIIVTLLILIFSGPFSAFLDLEKSIILIMVLQSFGTFIIMFASSSYTYDKEAYKTFLLSITAALATIGLSLVLMLKSDSFDGRAEARILGMAIPNILIGFTLFAVIMFRGKKTYSKKYWKFCLPLSMPLIFHGLSQIILSQADKIMLQKFTTGEIVGIYSFVVTFTHLINVIWLAFNNTWVPFYFDDMKNRNVENIKKKTKNYVFLFTGIVCGFMLVSPEVAKLFVSSEFWGGINLIPIFSVCMYMVFLYSFPVNFQFFYNRSLNIAIGTGLSAVLNIVLNFILIPRFGMYGAAIATLIAYISLFAFHQFIARYIIGRAYHFGYKDYWASMLFVAGNVALAYCLQGYWYARWVIAAGIGIVLVARIVKNKKLF